MKILWFSLCLGAAGGCQRDADPAALAAWAREARVIEAVAGERLRRWRRQDGRQPTILVFDRIGSGAHSGAVAEVRARGRCDFGNPETWDAFFASAERRLRVPPREEPSFRTISSSQAEGGYLDEGWSGAGIGVPEAQAYFTFTGLVFSADGSEALVEWGFHCGSLCGDGSISRLVFENGAWRLAETTVLWLA